MTKGWAPACAQYGVTWHVAESVANDPATGAPASPTVLVWARPAWRAARSPGDAAKAAQDVAAGAAEFGRMIADARIAEVLS